MKKMFLIGFKDLRLAFRDRAALIFMLAAPFLLTLGMGLVTGQMFGSDQGGLSQVEVVIVNQDTGELGQTLVDVFQSPEMGDLFAPTILADADEARRYVDDDQTAAAVIIPPDFSNSIMAPEGQPAPIALYTNPTRPTGSGVIQSVLNGYTQNLLSRRVAAEVTVEQMIRAGLLPPADAAALAAEVAARDPSAGPSIRLNAAQTGTEEVPFNFLAYLAPGMALMFLMFTVSNGGRTLLAEQALGTLPRLLVAPVTSAQVLGGKVIGIFLTGVTQMLILIGASTLLFGLRWGSPLAVLLLVLAAVFGASGWGLLITALSRSPGQVAGVGSAVMLIFGILGGSFISLENFGPAIRAFSKITPNAWGLDGFTALAAGGSLADITAPLAALLLMGAVLFAIAGLIVARQGFARR